jgi:2-C-methyl-D-erythritol 4-phosphate cytidylyltransferase
MSLTDDASALEVAGGSVVGFPGDPWNLKITTPHDLELAEIALDQRLAI